jgi:hypothetical protein
MRDLDSLFWYHTFFLNDNNHVLKRELSNRVLQGEWCHNIDADVFLENMKDVESGSVIDVGTNDGFFSLIFNSLGFDVTTTDACDRTTRRAIYEFLGKEDKFVHTNLYQLDKIDHSYDYLWCQDVICHLEHPLLAFRIFREICKKKIFLGVDRFTCEEFEFDFYANWNVGPSKTCVYANYDYTYVFAEDFIKQTLIDCGFMNPHIKFSYRAVGQNNMSDCGVRTIDVYEADVNPDRRTDSWWKSLDWTMVEPWPEDDNCSSNPMPHG